jgi:hypothetical protein
MCSWKSGGRCGCGDKLLGMEEIPVHWKMKDWSTILAAYSSDEDSDAGDSLNVLSVQKNAKRVAEVLHTLLPDMDRTFAGDAPLGMNCAAAMRASLAKSAAASRRSVGARGPKTSPVEPSPVEPSPVEPSPVSPASDVAPSSVA